MSTDLPAPGAAQQQRLVAARAALQDVQARWGVTREASEPVAALAVADSIAALLPKGLVRGQVVRVGGSTSLVLALAAEASRRGAWTAMVGMPAVGAISAARRGMDLSKSVLIPHPAAHAADVAGACLDGMDVVILGKKLALSDGDRRRLASRAKERGCVILTVDRWPGAHLELDVERTQWRGLHAGEGRLRDRDITVAVTGRRQPGVQRVRVSLDRDPSWVSRAVPSAVNEGVL
ncbi:hypothetical protein [Demequina sediminicola]|uniref:hypothetical protein n=1 Tax=Demequina sediminicola TaxID=1095026 RepID=UPI0007812877|nr:hypothetical protein [Demequina sediminicola]